MAPTAPRLVDQAAAYVETNGPRCTLSKLVADHPLADQILELVRAHDLSASTVARTLKANGIHGVDASSVRYHRSGGCTGCNHAELVW